MRYFRPKSDRFRPAVPHRELPDELSWAGVRVLLRAIAEDVVEPIGAEPYVVGRQDSAFRRNPGWANASTRNRPEQRCPGRALVRSAALCSQWFFNAYLAGQPDVLCDESDCVVVVS